MKAKKSKVDSLYIHIPFCNSICPYCDFLKILKNQDIEDKYIDELIKDLKEVKLKFNKFKTIFIGGGTPSALSTYNLERLLQILDSMHLKKYEFSIESTLDSISLDKLKILKKYKVNRISIGIQSFKKDILKDISRNNNLDIYSLIKLIKEYISNINLDFIYGFQNETILDIKENIKIISSIDVNHISYYSLSINKNTLFYINKIKEIDNELSYKMYKIIRNELTRIGFKQYEVSNFARSKKFQSLHNLTYWNNKEYLGVGCSASGYINNIRYTNSFNISKYIKGIREIDKEYIDNKLFKEYFFITKLRLIKGFSLNEYKKIFNEDFLITYQDKITKLINNKLVSIKNNHFKVTIKGLNLLNEVLLELI